MCTLISIGGDGDGGAHFAVHLLGVCVLVVVVEVMLVLFRFSVDDSLELVLVMF